MTGPATTTRLGRVRARVLGRLRAGGRYRWWVLGVALAGIMATSFPVTVLAASLKEVAADFDTSESVLVWVVTAPMLISALALPVLGKLGDLYGHRRVYLTGFAAATAIAFTTALAWDPLSLIGLRTLAQVTGAATQPTAMALIMAVFAPEERVKATGFWSFAGAGAPGIGLVVGGPIVDAVGWQPVFLLQGALAAVALVAGVLVLEETTERRAVPFDLAGAATLMLGIGGVVFGLNQAAIWGWGDPAVVAAFLVAPVGFASFVAVERRIDHPLLPLEFFARRNFSISISVIFFVQAAYMGTFLVTPFLLRFVFDYSVSLTAAVLVCRTLTFSLTSPAGGYLATRIGERAAARLGTGLVALSMVVLAVGAGTQAIGLVVLALFLQGAGNGTNRPSLTASIANAVETRDLGVAAATQRMMAQVGSVTGITVLGVLVTDQLVPSRFVAAYLVGAGFAALAVAGAGFLRSVDRSEPELVREEPRPVARAEALTIGPQQG